MSPFLSFSLFLHISRTDTSIKALGRRVFLVLGSLILEAAAAGSQNTQQEVIFLFFLSSFTSSADCERLTHLNLGARNDKTFFSFNDRARPSDGTFFNH